MIAYYCAACKFYYRPIELLRGQRCPECKEPAKPRVMLGGKVMGGV